MRRSVIPGLALVLVAGNAVPGAAQEPRKSQRGAVSQTVGTTVITISYDRPVARGRDLFGDDGIVPWGVEWTPGANIATVAEFSGDVEVAGSPLPAGKYSVWAIPGPEEWTLIFSNSWDQFHIPYPEGKDALRVRVRPVAAEHMETLVWYFPVVDGYSTELRIHWGETAVPIPVTARGGR